MAPEKKKFEVLKTAPVQGKWRDKGDVVEMSEAQATFLKLNGTLKPYRSRKKPASTEAAASPADKTKA